MLLRAALIDSRCMLKTNPGGRDITLSWVSSNPRMETGRQSGLEAQIHMHASYSPNPLRIGLTSPVWEDFYVGDLM